MICICVRIGFKNVPNGSRMIIGAGPRQWRKRMSKLHWFLHCNQESGNRFWLCFPQKNTTPLESFSVFCSHCSSCSLGESGSKIFFICEFWWVYYLSLLSCNKVEPWDVPIAQPTKFIKATCNFPFFMKKRKFDQNWHSLIYKPFQLANLNASHSS